MKIRNREMKTPKSKRKEIKSRRNCTNENRIVSARNDTLHSEIRNTTTEERFANSVRIVPRGWGLAKKVLT